LLRGFAQHLLVLLRSGGFKLFGRHEAREARIATHIAPQAFVLGGLLGGLLRVQRADQQTGCTGTQQAREQAARA
jgi:hypothetical protein